MRTIDKLVGAIKQTRVGGQLVFNNRNVFFGLQPEGREDDVKRGYSVVIDERDEVREQVFGGNSILRNTEYWLEFRAASPRLLNEVEKIALRQIRRTRRVSHHEIVDGPYAWDKKLEIYARFVRLIMFR